MPLCALCAWCPLCLVLEIMPQKDYLNKANLIYNVNVVIHSPYSMRGPGPPSV